MYIDGFEKEHIKEMSSYAKNVTCSICWRVKKKRTKKLDYVKMNYRYFSWRYF